MTYDFVVCIWNLKDQPTRVAKIVEVHSATKGLQPPDPNVFGLKVLFLMSSVETLAVSNDLFIVYHHECIQVHKKIKHQGVIFALM